ncbi:MAG: CAP domain-containing protein [Bacteroidota bacterium]
MKTLYITLLTLCGIFIPQLQALKAGDEFGVWADPKYEWANTARNELYLSPSEKEIVRLTNLARMNGPLFADTYIKKYYPTGSTDPYVQSLIDGLKKQRPLSPFTPSVALYHSAQSHAADMGLNGKTGCIGTNGLPFYDRIHRYFPGARTFAENNYYQAAEPVSIVLGMLVDRSDSTHGNRKNLLSDDIDVIGVSVQPHKLLCNTTVMDFAKRADNLPQPTSKNMRIGSNKDRCPESSKVPVRGLKKRKFILFPW